MNTTIKPCHQCPYRKDSARGYLGENSYKPQLFLEQLEFDDLHPCHLSVNWEEEDFNKSSVCVGALQFMNNSCKLHRNIEIARLQKMVGRNENILSFNHNFIKHHEHT